MEDDQTSSQTEGESEGAGGDGDLAIRLANQARHLWRPHLYAYLALNGGLALINWLVSDYWWSFWPMFATTILLACHFFLVKSLDPDHSWIEERGMWVKAKSYDIDHMRAIEQSYKTGTMPGSHSTDHGSDDEKPEG